MLRRRDGKSPDVSISRSRHTNDELRPGPDSKREFRDALGRFATGVTIVTTATPAGPVAITANSFASVSLDPPIVLWSIGRHSTRFELFAGCENFAVHVLGAEQVDLGQRFARSGDAFAGLAVGENEAGVPLLTECLSRFECSRIAGHDGGDHLIVLGRVAAAAVRDGEPLLFAGGEYGRFDRVSSSDRLGKEAGNLSPVRHGLLAPSGPRPCEGRRPNHWLLGQSPTPASHNNSSHLADDLPHSGSIKCP